MVGRRDERARARIPPSCWPCRRRKLKCDRGLPACSNCVHRGNITSCQYASARPSTPTVQSSSPSTSEAVPPEVPGPALNKLANLERIVPELVSNQKTRNEGRDEQDTQSSALPAVQHWTRQSVDEARWDSVFHDIQEVRAYLHAQHERYEDNKATLPLLPFSEEPAPTLLLGSSRNASRAEIVLGLPSKESCDVMIARFFSHLYPPLCQLCLRVPVSRKLTKAADILHEPSFRNQYEHFWQDPDSTTTVWIAVLFAILRIASLDYLREDDEPTHFKGKCQGLAVAYRQRLADCLVLADYLQPHEFLIEALILHQYGEYVSSRDAKSSIWVLTGTIIRLAMRMGYHQSSQPTLCQSPFKVGPSPRSRRRIYYANINTSEGGDAAKGMGIPATTRYHDVVPDGPTVNVDFHSQPIDLPRNMHDDDTFYEGCSTLPPVQPDSEPTKISYLIPKTKLAFGFAQALAEVNRKPSINCQRLLEIDRELRQTYEAVPEYYKLGRLQSQGSFVLCSARFSLAAIHYKSLCAIHSHFIGRETTDSRHLYSTKVCLTSALSILRMQATLTNYQTSLAIHDYLLAAAIISSYLFFTLGLAGSSAQKLPKTSSSSHGLPSNTEMIKVLENSTRIFHSTREQSVDAWKAADVLGVISKRFMGMIGDSRDVAIHAGSFRRRQQPPMPSSSQESNTVSPTFRRSTVEDRQTRPQSSDWRWSPEQCCGEKPMRSGRGEIARYTNSVPDLSAYSHLFAATPDSSMHGFEAEEADKQQDIDQSSAFDHGALTNNSPSASLQDDFLPALDTNQPLSTLWTLNNSGINLGAFSGL